MSRQRVRTSIPTPDPRMVLHGDRLVFYHRRATGEPLEGIVDTDSFSLLRVSDTSRGKPGTLFYVNDVRILEVWRQHTLIAATLRLPTDRQPTPPVTTHPRHYRFSREGDVVEFRQDNGKLALGIFRWNSRTIPTLRLHRRYRGRSTIPFYQIVPIRVWRGNTLVADATTPPPPPPPPPVPSPQQHTYAEGDDVSYDDERGWPERRNLRDPVVDGKVGGRYLTHVRVWRVWRDGVVVAEDPAAARVSS